MRLSMIIMSFVSEVKSNAKRLNISIRLPSGDICRMLIELLCLYLETPSRSTKPWEPLLNLFPMTFTETNIDIYPTVKISPISIYKI